MITPRLKSIYVLLLYVSIYSSATAQIDVQQYTKDDLPDYFVGLARANEPMAYPVLTIDSKTRDSHVGVLRSHAGGGEWRHQFITYTVVQQIAQGTLMEITYKMPSAVQIRIGGFRGAGAGSSRLPAVEETKGPFLFQSPKLKDLATDAEFTPSGVWIVDGTFDYVTTAGNTRRVLVIKELPKDIHPLPEFPELLSKELRVWRDKTGKFEVEAVLSDYERGEAKLRKKDGKVISISLAKLSDEDREWVRKHLKRQRDEERQPKAAPRSR